MVTAGHLPVTLDEAVFVAALQMHIEVSTCNYQLLNIQHFIGCQ